MKIETRSIEYIPANERHGKPRGLFAVWFAANMHITTLVTGSLCVTFGLNLFWSVVAIIVGNLIGAIFMASHSAQGPKLGIPQMIQSRAQFGVIGAVIPLILVIFMYLGFFASSGLLGAQVLSSALNLNLTLSIIVLNIITFIVTMIGHDLIHKMQKYLTWVFFLVFIVATFIVFQLPVPSGSWSPAEFNLPIFMLSVSVVATWQISYAPYVADYSRYLPIDTNYSKTFWYTYAGTILGTVWMMVLGVLLTTAIPNFLSNSGTNLAHQFGSFSFLLFAVIILGQFSINVFNLYGAFMSTISTVEPFSKIKVTPKVRMYFIFGIGTVGTLLAIWGQGNFLSNFINFILFISYFLIPWTAINLIDFYVLRHGEYSIKDIFDLNGKYGKVNKITAISFLVSIIAEVPFMNTSFYVGPGAKAMGGADIAWILGLVVPSVLYYVLMKRKLKGPSQVPIPYEDSKTS
ncbi:putative purine-cytosine permease [Neobacillus bataviensis LMG 21833]|uniref:Putative purine-cytosine permease n=1 Tax=Neobacillus bataviensis LMG 21833 TaxID=1117379 RepID=K6D9U5_9BACI|nr:cytosine permease [Neobacillus bataviensis]EKN69307.1 putative purine-cytosine permease [Neobacillus bataviensis LMG 21833]